VIHVRRGVWILTGLAAGLVIVIVMLAAAIPLSSNTLRHRIVRSLSERLNSEVELGDLTLRVFPRMQAEGRSLVIRDRGRSDVPPLISIKQFKVDADLAGLIRKHVARVELVGLTIQIPPGKHEGPEIDQSDRAVATIGKQPDHKPHTDPASLEDGVVVDTLESTDAELVIIPRKANKAPKVWAIHWLKLHDVAASREMPFTATLRNAVPPGEIATSGTFGPWHTGEPADTPLKGEFKFEKADLGVFKGIGGTLSSKGSFGGALGRIEVNGETDTPDFVVKIGGHPLPLHTKYYSIVDGTNGDTLLENIDATFPQSHLVAKGAVLDAPKGVKGRIVSLDVNMDRARIEDVMRMAVHTQQPPMTGGLTLSTKFLLPPGEADVSQRLRLDGQFEMASARFTNYDVQGKIDELSHRGSGKDPDSRKDGVFSRFDGRFKLANGRLDLPELKFEVPGALVELAGFYELKPETLQFAGTMTMDAKISETQKGWKAVALKVIDPFFTKDGGGSAVPFKIEGTRNDPKFTLDVRRVFKRDGKS
jgi:hypothetical protein